MDLSAILSALRVVAEWLAPPPILFGWTLVVFVLGTRTRFLWRRPAGVVWLLLAAALLAVATADPLFRQRLLNPRHFPVVIWVLCTLGALWLVLHRARRERTLPPHHPDAAWRGPSRFEWTAATITGLLLMAAALYLETPLGPPGPDTLLPAPAGQALLEPPETIPEDYSTDVARKPWFTRAWQEAGFYFDPWMARFLFPMLLLIGLLALPWLDPDPDEEAPSTSASTISFGSRERRLLIFLASTLFLVLLPMVVATYLRGPSWNVLSPFEIWQASPATTAPVALSERFWCDALGRSAPPAFWLIREFPGLAFLCFYLIILPRQLPRWKATRGIFDRYLRSVGPWRYRLAATLGLLLLAVPLKMYSRWLLDVSYWLHLPEIAFNF